MDAITLEDILEGDGFLRKGSAFVEGLGEVQIHEFPASEVWAITDKCQDPQNLPEDEYFVSCAIRFMKGHDYKPKKAELEALPKKLGKDVIEAIYMAGLRFNSATTKALEEAEKNPNASGSYGSDAFG